jgi:hypothetical protein
MPSRQELDYGPADGAGATNRDDAHERSVRRDESGASARVRVDCPTIREDSASANEMASAAGDRWLDALQRPATITAELPCC